MLSFVDSPLSFKTAFLFRFPKPFLFYYLKKYQAIKTKIKCFYDKHQVTANVHMQVLKMRFIMAMLIDGSCYHISRASPEHSAPQK